MADREDVVYITKYEFLVLLAIRLDRWMQPYVWVRLGQNKPVVVQLLGNEPGPNPGVRLTYSEAVQKQSHQTGSSHTRSSNAVNGKVASATPDQLNTSFNL